MSKPIPLREPSRVMRLERLGAMHQSRLSFMRILVRRMRRERWQFSRPVFEVDARGVGHAVMSTQTPRGRYSLVAFFHELDDELRSDRVIAEAWDATFALFDGVPEDEDIQRLSRNVPLQEAGRLSCKELTLSRANRSDRLWWPVIESLASGVQPEAELLRSVGYLMRTTAVYGSGKFGAADREDIADRPEFSAPFQVEMLTVYLIRAVVRDLLQHMANSWGGERSVTLDTDMARNLGIGNSTGLGMAPFLLNHPMLFNNWVLAREKAIARVRSLPEASAEQWNLFRSLLASGRRSLDHWATTDPEQAGKIARLRLDLLAVQSQIDAIPESTSQPWNHLHEWADQMLSLEGQEYLASLMLEPYGDLVDSLAESLSHDRAPPTVDGNMSVAELKALLERNYEWALDMDWQTPGSQAHVWYISEEKQEPRLGLRDLEDLDDYEQPLAPARDAAAVYSAIGGWSDTEDIGDFLLQHPEFRQIVRRVQSLSALPYAEIRDNTIGESLLPIDLLRCKLAFFGATRFDPRSDRWVRIRLFANAPYPEELNQYDSQYWPFSSANTLWY